jgi:hypothetical protein
MIWLIDPANTIIDPFGRPSLKLAAVGHEDEDTCTQEQYS